MGCGSGIPTDVSQQVDDPFYKQLKALKKLGDQLDESDLDLFTDPENILKYCKLIKKALSEITEITEGLYIMNKNMEDSSLQAIADSFKFCKGLKKIELEFWNPKIENFQTVVKLGESFGQFKKLTEFNFQIFGMNDIINEAKNLTQQTKLQLREQSVGHILRGLTVLPNQQLLKLKLDITSCKFGELSYSEIVNALKCHESSLQELSLQLGSLQKSWTGVNFLSQQIGFITNLIKLEISFDFSLGQDDQEWEQTYDDERLLIPQYKLSLFESLEKLNHLQELYLQLSSFMIDEEMGRSLAKSIYLRKEYFTSLTISLVPPFQYSTGYEMGSSFYDLFSSISSFIKIKELNFAFDNYLVSNEDTKMLTLQLSELFEINQRTDWNLGFSFNPRDISEQLIIETKIKVMSKENFELIIPEF